MCISIMKIMKKSDSYHLSVLLFVYILKFLCNMKWRHDKG